jgi:hypothetical protein
LKPGLSSIAPSDATLSFTPDHRVHDRLRVVQCMRRAPPLALAQPDFGERHARFSF